MEYNFQSMLGTDARLRLVATEKEAYEPCASLPGEYAYACVFWQPQWWISALFSGEASIESYRHMGRHCRTLGTIETLLRACFEGLGNITPQAGGYDAKTIAALCAAASSEQRERLFCSSLAANVLGIESSVAEGKKVCQDFSGSALSYCFAYANNEASLVNQLLPPASL